MTGFYQRGSFQAKWSVSVVIFSILVTGALASGLRPLISLSGLLIVLVGLALVRGWGGLPQGLSSGYRRWGMPVSVSMLRFTGRVVVGMGVIWTLAPLIGYL